MGSAVHGGQKRIIQKEEVTMRHIFTIALFTAVMALTSCGMEIETSGNGDLDGFWNLTQVDSTATGVTADVHEQRLFWSVQHKLLQLSDYQNQNPMCLLRFEKNGQQLTLSSPFFYNRDEGDQPIDDISVLAPYGINAMPETFQIQKLNSSKMVLKTDIVTLYFTRF